MSKGRFYQFSSSDSESEKEEVAKVVEKRVFESSDSDEDEKRIVRSGKVKRYEELENIVKNLKNHKKNRDISNVLLDFESLIKSFEKAKKIIDSEGIPKFYIRNISELEDYVTDLWDNHKKTLSKNNGKSLTTLRQKIRKYNKDFEVNIKDFKENPELYPEDVNQEIKNEPEEDIVIEPIGDDIRIDTKAEPKDESESESDDWDETSSASSTEDEEEKELYKNNPAARFLKRADEKTTEKKKKDKKERFSKEKKKKHVSAEDSDGDGWTAVDGTGRPERTVRVFDKNEEINSESVMKKIEDICQGRIVKRGQRQVQLEMLEQLHKIVVERNMGPGFRIKLLISCTSFLLQYNNKANPCMKIEMWSTVLANVSTIIDILMTNIDILTLKINVLEESENIVSVPYRLHGCIINLLEHMDDEYTKILQNVPEYNRGTDYIEKLRYETQVFDLCSKLNSYLEQKDYSSDDICRAYLRKVEHLYYRFDHLFNKSIIDHDQSESYKEMKRLCRYIISKDQTDRLRTRAILCHIYFLALHDHWHEARDMMAMSNLQNSIDRSDPSTQILYNRSMVQLGLCAFRQGFIKDAHQSLADLQGSGRVKELLAQGITPNRFDRSKEDESREKSRLLPYHEHVNLELVECVYLVSAMLTDTAHCLVAHYPDGRRRMISRNFHHVLKSSERQTLVGPPETMRDHVVAASKALFVGDWRLCVANVVNCKMNGKVWDLFHNSGRVKEMLVEKIKVESVRTFLLGHSSIYDSLSLGMLAKQFELDIAAIQQIISKMILMDELMASLDEPTNCLIMHRTEPSRLQTMALRLAERVIQISELNERLVEIRNTLQMPLRGSGGGGGGGGGVQQQQNSYILTRERLSSSLLIEVGPNNYF